MAAPGPPSEDARRRRRRIVVLVVVVLLLLLLLLLLSRCGSPPPSTAVTGSTTAADAVASRTQQRERRPGTPGSSPQGEGGSGGPLSLPQGSTADWLARAMSPEELAAFEGGLAGLRPGTATLPVSGRGASPLAQFLPEAIDAAARGQVVSLRSELQQSGGVLGEARAFYGDEAEPRLLLSLTDGGLAAAGDSVRLMLAGDSSRETPAGSEIVRAEGDRILTLRWRRAEREASAAVLLGRRVRVTASMRDTDSTADAEAALRRVDWAGIEALLQRSPLREGSGAVAANDVGYAVGEGLRRAVEASQAQVQPAPAAAGAGDPQVLLSLLPASIGAQAAVSRQGREQRVSDARTVPMAEVSYAAAAGGTLQLRLEQDPPNLGLLGARERTWETLQAMRSDAQQLAVVDGRRTLLTLDGSRQRAQYRVLLRPQAVLTASATGAGAEQAVRDAVAAVDLTAIERRIGAP